MTLSINSSESIPIINNSIFGIMRHFFVTYLLQLSLKLYFYLVSKKQQSPNQLDSHPYKINPHSKIEINKFVRGLVKNFDENC